MTPDESDLEAFVLDLFGVIISFDNDIVYSRLARRCADPEGAVRNLDGLMAGHDVVTGQLSLRQVHRRLVDAYGLAMDYPQFEAAWLEPYSEPMPGMADLVTILSENYRLVLLSNVDPYYWEVVRAAHRELNCFDALLVSCDVGLAKPDLEMFRLASRAAGTDPGRCLFVDDTQANVDAARSLGFRTHRFRGVLDLRRELRLAKVRGFGCPSQGA